MDFRKIENLKEYQNRTESLNNWEAKGNWSLASKGRKTKLLYRKGLTDSALKSRRKTANKLWEDLDTSINQTTVNDYNTAAKSSVKQRKHSHTKYSWFNRTRSKIKSICDKRNDSSILNNTPYASKANRNLDRSFKRAEAYASFSYKLSSSSSSTSNLKNECLIVDENSDGNTKNLIKEEIVFLPKDAYFSSQNKFNSAKKSSGVRSWRKYRRLDNSIKLSKNNLSSSFKTNNIEKCEKVLDSMDAELFGNIPTSLIANLYYAKCQDLGIDPTESQMRRFIEFWKLNLKSRKAKLREWGFGSNWAKVFANILANFDICTLDLRKNMIGNNGIKKLCKGIAQSKTLIHVDLGSNDITADGANYFFESILNNQYLTSFSLANVDGLHRNRIGVAGWKGLSTLLKTNKIISMIDISDNSIGNEGIRNMLKDIDPSQSEIAYINLSNNELSQGWIDELSSLLKSKSFFEIRLGNNNLTDKTAQELASYFYRGYWHLAKLDLSYNKLTSVGCSHLFHALKLNPYLTHLNLESNNLSKGKKFNSIISMLKSNKVIKSINLSKCELTSNEAEMLADGLSANTSVTTLNLSRNDLYTQGWIYLFDWLCNNSLKLSHIDLSYNHIEDEAIKSLSKTLEVNTYLQRISLYSNMLSKNSCNELMISLK